MWCPHYDSVLNCACVLGTQSLGDLHVCEVTYFHRGPDGVSLRSSNAESLDARLSFQSLSLGSSSALRCKKRADAARLREDSPYFYVDSQMDTLELVI